MLKRARLNVHESGYTYSKGKSRSKSFEGREGTPKRTKVDSESRVKRMKDIEEDLASIKKRMMFKEQRIEAGVAVKNFTLCDQLEQEIVTLKQERREKEAEHRLLVKKEKKSMWHFKKKRLSCSEDSEMTSDDTDSTTTRSRSETPLSPPFCDSELPLTSSSSTDLSQKAISDEDEGSTSNKQHYF